MAVLAVSVDYRRPLTGSGQQFLGLEALRTGPGPCLQASRPVNRRFRAKGTKYAPVIYPVLRPVAPWPHYVTNNITEDNTGAYLVQKG